MIAVVEPSRPRKKQQQKIKVVDKIQKDLQNIADISKKRIVGDEEGNGEKNDKAEKADDNTPAPVAVDMGDNPLNFRIVGQLPEFPGGMSAFVKWLTDNLRYPPVAQRQKIQGRVVISFVINRDGSICDLKVAHSVNPNLDNEALRVARMMPRWKPGIDKNRPCRTLFASPWSLSSDKVMPCRHKGIININIHLFHIINMINADQILKLVNDYLVQLPYDRRPASLYEPIRYVLSMGGKRIRPVLMLLSYNLFKEDPETILMPACALETYHNYTLLHDDLMDNADLRRGHETVHKKWNANTAILSGDSMLVLAYQRMQQCSSDKMAEVLALFTETALEIGEGQEYDMAFEHRDDVSEEEYIEMIRLKTSVLLACALKIGAILAGASKEDADNLYRFGEQIGLAFQLQDDFLDVYGDTRVFGKAIGGDITSNKKTFMLINALNHANDDQRRQLESWISATEFDRDEKVAAVTRLYNEIGIDRMAQDKIAYYFEQSRKYLQAVSVDESRKAELAAYAQRMMNRQY